MLHRATSRSTNAVAPMHSSRKWISSIVASPLRVTWVTPVRPAVVAAAAAADSTGFTESFKGLLKAMHTAGLSEELHSALGADNLGKHKVRGTSSGDHSVIVITIIGAIAPQGDIKRALLDLARTRPHYLSAMDTDTLKALASAPLDTDERKVRMAQQRLQASYVEGSDMPIKDGGAASLQDVLRLLQCLEGADQVQQGVCVSITSAYMHIIVCRDQYTHTHTHTHHHVFPCVQ